MKLERLALWEERYLFTEHGEAERGFAGWLKGKCPGTYARIETPGLRLPEA